MKRFLAPLGVFLAGQFVLLLVLLLFPAIGDAETQMAADIAGEAWLWGKDWISTEGVIRLLVILIIEGFTLFGVAKAFLRQPES